MNVGITYDLKDDYLKEGFSPEDAAEFDANETISGIDHALQSLGYQTDRIGHVKSLVHRLCQGERWDLVFNIAEGVWGMAREAQIPAILDAYNIPYTFSDPMVLSLCLHKGMTKRIIRDAGIPTADFYVVEKEEDMENLDLPYPLFAKPVAEGTSKGINNCCKINNREELQTTCQDLLSRFRQPVIVETYLPGREFTVGMVGSGKSAQTLGTVEILILQGDCMDFYSYTNKARFQERVIYTLVKDETAKLAEEIALKSWQTLGCRDCGRVDLRCDEKGVPNFIEVNPLAGLNPEVSDLPILCRLAGISYKELIGMIMSSALNRILTPRKEILV